MVWSSLHYRQHIVRITFGFLLANLVLVSGDRSLAYAQEPSAELGYESAAKSEAEIEKLDAELTTAPDIDSFDAKPIYPEALRTDLIGGLVYKPDAIPLSQYKRQNTSTDSLIAHSNTGTLMGDGSQQKSYYAAIYSGSTNGVYFQVAATICKLMRQTYSRHRVHCVPMRSQGVGSNIELMKEGRVQMALVQSNNNWEAQNGINPIPGARSVMSLHDEMGMLVVRNDSGINSVSDLRGKRINIGPEGSASRELWLQLLGKHGIKLEDLEQVFDVAQDYNKLGICEDYIDAYGLWIGHPSSLIEESLTCDAKVVGMGGPLTEALVEENKYFFDQVLPARTYRAQEEAIKSYGFKASLIAYEPADPYVIYWVTRIIHENIEKLKSEYPTFRSVSASDLKAKGNFLPFHKGAACYWETDSRACDWQRFYEDPAQTVTRSRSNHTYQQ